MLARIPRGGCGIVAPDLAYDSYGNCRLIAEGGRVPVTRPARGNEMPRWFGARARMPRWLCNRPDEFWRAYHQRSRAGSPFSVILLYEKSVRLGSGGQ